MSKSIPMPEKSFKERVENFIREAGLPAGIHNEFRNEISKLILTIQELQGASVLRALSRKENFFDDFKYFKDTYLDKSAYIHRVLWREVIYFLKSKDMRSDEKILMEDVLYVVNNLKDCDIEKIYNMQINMDLNVALEMDTFTTGENVNRDIYTYVKSKANTLKYLPKYDFGLANEDLQHDLIEEVLRVNNSYNKSSGKNVNASENFEDNVRRYIETALNNKVSQIKDYWGSDNRRRVSSTHASLYRKRGTLRKAVAKEKDAAVLADLHQQLEEIEHKIKTLPHDYFSTVTPLVRTNESENREVDAQEIDPSTISDDQTIEGMWVHDLILDLPPRLSRCVKIITGVFDEEFEEWCKSTKPKANLNLLDHLFRCAMEFTNVSKDELKNSPVIMQALSDNRLVQNTMYRNESDIMVQNLITKKLHPAKLEDSREDGSIIFYLVSDKTAKSKSIDTGYDKKWKLVGSLQ